jgi:6-phosphofructokinase 1
MNIKRIGILTSGGDAPGMNACVRAAVRTALHHHLEIKGVKRGYQGLIENEVVDLNSESVSNILQLGGTILRSARSEEFRSAEGREKAYHNLKANGIDALITIGGDGTFKGALAFMETFKDIPILGCPGTIDNDLYGTDYTIGYDTAINTAMNAIDNIKDTANSHDRLFLVEVMGRDAGFIALRSGIATGAEAVMIPESKMSVDKLIEILKQGRAQKKNASIVVVAEGDEVGGAFKLAELIQQKGFSDYEIKVSILGHIQRGGRPTCMERVRASQMGMAAVEGLLQGRKGEMVGIIHDDVVYTPFELATKHNTEINKIMLEMVRILA